MDQVSDLKVALENALGTTFNSVAGFLPKLFAALVIWIIGGFVAKAIRWAAEKILKTIKFNDIADKIGLTEKLKAGGVKSSAAGLMAKLVYWMIMLTVYMLAFNALGLEVVSDLLTSVVQFIPKIIVACILLIVGMFLADFVKDLVKATLKTGSFDNPNLVANIAYYAVMFVAASMAINTVGIGGDIINTIVTAVFGALSLGLAIAFGLGGRDAAARTINKVSKMD
jgi:hypothetical protein